MKLALVLVMTIVVLSAKPCLADDCDELASGLKANVTRNSTDFFQMLAKQQDIAVPAEEGTLGKIQADKARIEAEVRARAFEDRDVWKVVLDPSPDDKADGLCLKFSELKSAGIGLVTHCWIYGPGDYGRVALWYRDGDVIHVADIDSQDHIGVTGSTDATLVMLPSGPALIVGEVHDFDAYEVLNVLTWKAPHFHQQCSIKLTYDLTYQASDDSARLDGEQRYMAAHANEWGHMYRSYFAADEAGRKRTQAGLLADFDQAHPDMAGIMDLVVGRKPLDDLADALLIPVTTTGQPQMVVLCQSGEPDGYRADITLSLHSFRFDDSWPMPHHITRSSPLNIGYTQQLRDVTVDREGPWQLPDFLVPLGESSGQ